MAKSALIVALALIGAALAAPPPQKEEKTTIFLDETLEGQVFEGYDLFARNAIVLRNEEQEAYRLPTTTRPIHYDILWSTDFNTLSFAGQVSIQLAATQAGVNQIVIHSDELTITSTTLELGTTNIPIAVTYDTVHAFMIVTLSNNAVLTYNPTTPVAYNLTISFEAPMRSDMYGIYRSWFKNDNVTRWMASTQFQATAARQAFPCYDEPSFKATVNITIRRPSTYRSWSNMRIAETTTSTVVQNYEEDRYYTTPVMSTYLLAIIVAEYDSIDAYNGTTLMYDVIARPNAISTGQGDYAFNVGQDLLQAMSDHTGIDFYSVDPNLKMTQAAIPDFGAGAMENWGLLTYREAYLLYDPEHTNGYFQQIIAYILSHEIAHMWFGNLATCSWWDVLWLNEGFARYYQYFLTHWVETEMGFETRFIVEQVHTSLLSDSANNPQPLTNPGIGSPAAVSSMFSTISYNKGAAVIRMTEHLLGFEVHRQGLNNYLTQKAFQVADPIDLFTALQEIAEPAGAIAAYGTNFSIPEYYFSWTDQPGHPVLNVQVNHATGDMLIQQRRFNINNGFSDLGTNYIIPVTFSTASNPDFANTKPTHIIRDTATVINKGSTGDEWVIFNKQQTGFYRVNYDEYTWNLNILALRNNRTLIHEYNRAQIVNDVFQFARSGLMTYTRAFNILSFLENETDYAPWVAAITGFSWIRNRLVGSNLLEPVNALLVRWATTVMNEIGYYEVAGESFMRSYLRYQLAPIMCNVNVQACRTAATARFQALRNNGVEIDPDSRNWVYCNALRDGTEADFNFLWDRFQNHNVYTEKILILMTIGCTPYENSLNTFLDGIVQENELVRPQDYTTAFNTAVSGNEGNTQIVFRYIQQNLQTVRNAFGNLITPLSYVSSRLRSEQEIQEFLTWATANQAVLGTEYQAIFNGAQNSQISLQWAAQVADDINQYLTEGDQAIVTTTSAPTTGTETTTLTPDEIVEPDTPDIPDSASTTFVSMFTIVFAVVVKFIL